MSYPVTITTLGFALSPDEVSNLLCAAYAQFPEARLIVKPITHDFTADDLVSSDFLLVSGGRENLLALSNVVAQVGSSPTLVVLPYPSSRLDLQALLSRLLFAFGGVAVDGSDGLLPRQGAIKVQQGYLRTSVEATDVLAVELSKGRQVFLKAHLAKPIMGCQEWERHHETLTAFLKVHGHLGFVKVNQSVAINSRHPWVLDQSQGNHVCDLEGTLRFRITEPNWPFLRKLMGW